MQGNFLEDSEQWSQHTVQSIVWSAAGAACNVSYWAPVDTWTGCEKLAIIEENLVTAFSEVGGDNNNAITVTLNRTYRVCVPIVLNEKKYLIRDCSALDKGNIRTPLLFFLSPTSGEA